MKSMAEKKVRPALRKAGRTFLLVDHFPDSSDASGQDSESNDPYLGRVRPALRKAGRTLAIGL